MLINLGLPFLTFVIVNSVLSPSYHHDEEYKQLYATIAFLIVCLLLCARGWYYRYQERCETMRLVYERQQHQQGEDDEYLDKQRCYTLCATAVCGCVPIEHDDTYPTNRSDFCTSLWKFVSACCCGMTFRCWCQCCGMCAIAQQDRELSQEESIKVDYITFEPWQEYATKLQDLRIQQETFFWKHLQNMSMLSYRLLGLLAWSLVVLGIVAFLRVERNFTLVNMLVVIATFFQAFLILYFVHWQWHRFDLSLDAVIKYFSSGFVLCTGLAVVFEMLVSTLLACMINVIVLVMALSEQADIPNTPKEAREFAREFQKEHLAVFLFFTFLNALVVAALVEETCKYFGFWMVEHPDFENTTTRESRGVGITVAMVATALGFACCENLLYVFVYTPPSLANEVATLVARSIFPIHPLAAALQSIGVCRRDLEGDRKLGLGRILVPAILLHGSFDFVLMVMALIQSVQQESVDDDDVVVVTVDDDAIRPQQSLVRDEMPSLIASVVIVLIGLIYYVWEAEAQRIRLHELDLGVGRPSSESTRLIV